MPMKEKEVAQLPGLRQWLRYWRNSLADAESGRGALTRRELEQSLPVGREAYRQGRLAPEVVGRLFSGEAESVELLRVVLRPAVYMALLEHGQGRRALFPEVMTPLICVLWVTREGRLIPAEPPVIPRDLLGPQADDRFTLNDVVEQDRFLTLEMPRVWSAQEAQGLLEEPEETWAPLWQGYYEVSRRLFEQLVPPERLKAHFVSADQARLLKVEESVTGASQHILNLYDWLDGANPALPLLETYALSSRQNHRPCVDALATLDARLGHANSAYPTAVAQRDALAQAMAMEEGEILAVNGPPGTGKTTFVLDVVASLWVQAALAEGEPPLIIAASTNNQAVTNILTAFAKDFEETDHPLSGRWLPDIHSYGGYYPAPSREAEAARHYQTPAFYRDSERPESTEHAESEFLRTARRALEDDSLESVRAVRQRLHAELSRVHARLVDIHSQWQRLQDLEEALGPDAEADQRQDQQSLEALQAALAEVQEDARRWKDFRAEEPLWLSMLSLLPPIARKRRLRRELFIEASLSARSHDILGAATGDAPERALARWLASQQQEVARCQARLDERLAQLEARDLAAEALRAELPDPAASDSLEAIDRSLDTTLRFRLFQLAVHYWETRWLEACREQGKELAEQAASGRERRGLATVRPRWRRRMMLTPCIVSTLHSLPSHMTHSVFEGEGQFRIEYLVNEIDLLIIDEAGQVSPEVAGASLALARRALVIGDVHQIPPVATQLKSVDVGNLSHQGLLTSLSDYDALRETGRSVVDGSAMRIAQVASRYRYLEEAEPGMFLREHRRCLSEIIAYCNDLCYEGLLLPKRTTPATDPELPPFAYVHVDGRVETAPSGSRCNRLEAETLAEWLAVQRSTLEARHGLPLGQIVGVITPFKAQVEQIQQACRERDIPVGQEENAVTVGTVHALQGAERPVVLFSAVYSRHEDGGFIDRDPAMLNVAVSRAKDSFLVFADMDVVASAPPGSPRRLLSRYLLAREENALAFAIDRARPDLLAQCREPQVLTDVEQHDACLHRLLEEARARVVLVSPWVSLNRLEESGLLQQLGAAAGRGVEVTLYTDHHFNTTVNNRPCPDRTARFATCREALEAHGVAVKVVHRVHSKLVMADDRFICVGSYNWGSAVRQGKYRNMETSILYSGQLSDEIRMQREALEGRLHPRYPVKADTATS